MGQYNFDSEQARQLASRLIAGARQIAAAPQIGVTGGVRMSFTENINRTLQAYKTAANGNKDAYSQWMQDYANRMLDATEYQETFEDGVRMQARVEQQKVEDTPQSSSKPQQSDKTIDRPTIDI
ncbi:hypothetical protein [Bifidobacterium bifidum]|uniref:hypothetical protein n=1 Tax=Bifidobacterium bifidum TaxID=1681 RepID=UPI0012ABC648|nr:hypothetical protein [Bifidobacterium bifidum]